MSRYVWKSLHTTRAAERGIRTKGINFQMLQLFELLKAEQEGVKIGLFDQCWKSNETSKVEEFKETSMWLE